MVRRCICGGTAAIVATLQVYMCKIVYHIILVWLCRRQCDFSYSFLLEDDSLALGTILASILLRNILVRTREGVTKPPSSPRHVA